MHTFSGTPEGANLPEALSCGQIDFVNYRSLTYSLMIAGSISIFASCTNNGQGKSHGPIVLGDTASIVTETDPDKLVDQVPDLKPLAEEESTPAAEVKEDPAAATPAKPEETPPAAAQQPTGNGQTIAFKEVTLFIPNITTRSYGNKNLLNARGASYELKTGTLPGNSLRITNGSVQKITQRYQTIIALKDGNEVLPLESLGTYSSEWEALRGNGSVFAITGLEPNKLEAEKVTPAAIRNAVAQAGRRARMSRNELADWQDFAKGVRSATQAPAAVILRTVSWRVEGKDARGKAFNKEVRMDLPR